MLNVNLSEVKINLLSTYESVASKIIEWNGKTITVLKAGFQSALPYLQDEKIAIVALICVNICLIESIDFLFRSINYAFDLHEKIDRNLLVSLEAITGAGIVFSGISAFASSTSLPLSTLSIVSISLATFAAMALIHS